MSRPLTFPLYVILLVIGLGAIVYALGVSAGGPQSGSGFERFKEGDLAQLDLNLSGEPIPEGTFAGPDGETLTLAAFEGQTVLVNFWATWCAPCEREMPHLGALETARGSDAFKVVAISVDDSADIDYARERLEELTGGVLEFYHAPPENWDVVYGAGARGFPTTVIYGPDGTEIARLAGEADWSTGIALAFVDAVLEP